MVETIRLHGDEHAVVQCGTCGVWHTVPLVVYNNLRRHGGFHFCPVAGHQWGWRRGQEEADAIRLERDRLKQEIACIEDDRAAAWRAEAEATAARKKAEAALKRTMNRVENGVCTHCNRSFSNLLQHMKTCHIGAARQGEKDVLNGSKARICRSRKNNGDDTASRELHRNTETH